MTSASKSRVQRRAAAQAATAATAYKPGDPAKAIITLTEVPGTGSGFTIGLGLHGARMEELFPGQPHPVSIVDVLALALSNMLRSQPPAFKDAVNLVNETLRNIQQKVDSGGDILEAMAEADTALEGAMADVEPAAAE